MEIERFLSAAFGLAAGTFVAATVVEPAVFILAPIFGGVSALFYSQIGVGVSDRTRRRVSHGRQYGGRKTGETDTARPSGSEMPISEARDVLGVGSATDDEAVKRAYRERVKETHPDTGGDEEEFKRVRRAYERLAESES